MEKTRRGVEKMGRTFSSSSRAIGLLHPNAFENRRRLAGKSRSRSEGRYARPAPHFGSTALHLILLGVANSCRSGSAQPEHQTCATVLILRTASFR
jgi:hypothetical protein